MGKAELDAAIAVLTGNVAQLNTDANAIIAAAPGATDLTAETQAVNDAATTVKQIDDNLNAAFPPPPVVTP